MIPAGYVRHFAASLLRLAIGFAPRNMLDWGNAMLAELRHVESDWGALVWALGGAGVLAKYAAVSLIVPGRNRPAFAPSGGLFAGEKSMRKATLFTSGACVVSVALFSLVPAWREAFRLSLAPWRQIIGATASHAQPRLEALAKRAEAQRDAEALAFCAVRLYDSRESARLADEAVRLDPKLTWVYAVVASRHPELPEIKQLLSKLECWDPQNAFFHFIEAESSDSDYQQKVSAGSLKEVNEMWEKEVDDPAWRLAMAAAFASPKYDDYLSRLEELDRSVVLRFGFNDPIEVLDGEQDDIPSLAFWDSQRYAISLLNTAEEQEERGDRRGAAEKIATVARFGQMLDSHAHTAFEHWLGLMLWLGPCSRSSGQYEKGQNLRQAAVVARWVTDYNAWSCPGGT